MEETQEMRKSDVLEKLYQEIEHSEKYPKCVRVQINYLEHTMIRVKHSIVWWDLPQKIWSIRICFYSNYKYQYEMIIKSFDPLLAIDGTIKALKR